MVRNRIAPIETQTNLEKLAQKTQGLFKKNNQEFFSHLARDGELFWQLLTLDKANPISQKFWDKFDGGVISEKDVTMRMALIDLAIKPNNSNVFLRAAQEQRHDLLLKLAEFGANLNSRDGGQKSFSDYLGDNSYELITQIYELSPQKGGVVRNIRGSFNNKNNAQNEKLSEYKHYLVNILEGYIEANKVLETERIDPSKGWMSKFFSALGGAPGAGAVSGVGVAAANHIEGNLTREDLTRFAQATTRLEKEMTLHQIAESFALEHASKINKLELESKRSTFYTALGFKNNKIHDLAKEHAQGIFEVFVGLESGSAQISPTRHAPSIFTSLDNPNRRTITIDQLIVQVEDRQDNLILHKASSCLGCLGYKMRSNRVDAIDQKVQAEELRTQQPSPQPAKSPLGRPRIDRLRSINVSSPNAGKLSPPSGSGSESPLSAASTPATTPIRVQGSSTAPNSASRESRLSAMKVEGNLTAPPPSPREFGPSAMEVEGSLKAPNFASRKSRPSAMEVQGYSTAPGLNGRKRPIYTGPSFPRGSNYGGTPNPTLKPTDPNPQALSPPTQFAIRGIEPLGGLPATTGISNPSSRGFGEAPPERVK